MKRTLRLAALLAFCVLTFAARCHNLRDVFIGGRIYFADADCYSRMTRARMVAEHPGMIVKQHDFENWPQGVKSHTTAPLDYLIVVGKKVLDAGFAIFDSGKTSVLHDQTLDLAGALIGPLLGVVGAVFLAVWAWALRLRMWGMALLLYAVSPSLVHGTLLGRPDHQALLIVLLLVALGAEIALTRKTVPCLAGSAGGEVAQPPSAHPERKEGSSATGMESGDSGGSITRGTLSDRGGFSTSLHSAQDDGMKVWGIVAGVAWGLSLWVSLYEPLILLAAVLVLWLAFDRRALQAPERRAGWVTFAAVLAVAFLLEGWRIETPDAAMRGYFTHWKASIGELAHLDLRSSIVFRWLGWMVLAAPVLLAVVRKAERRALPVLALLSGTLGLAVWQIRWGYFLAAVFVLALPIFMPALRQVWIAWPVFIIALWPVAQDWDAQLFPDETAQRGLTVKRVEKVQLRALAERLRGDPPAPFLAPWWLSPALAYWSGHPGVAGSSHESLPGIVDSARLFLAVKPEDAVPLLRARRVRWVIADEARRMVSTSAALLGLPLPSAEPFGSVLAQRPREAPPWLEHVEWSPGYRNPGGGFPVGETEFYRLYRVVDEQLPP